MSSSDDCIEWQIIDAFINRLKEITIDNGYKYDVKTVDFFPEDLNELSNTEYFALFIIPQEPDIITQYIADDIVYSFVILCLDNKTKDDTGERMNYRYRNIKSDVTKCLNLPDNTLDNLCNNIKVTNSSCIYDKIWVKLVLLWLTFMLE